MIKIVSQSVKETLVQIRNLKEEITGHLDAVREQRAKHPHSRPYTISDTIIDGLFKQCDSIRDGAELTESDTFLTTLGQVETLLKKLRVPIQFRRSDILGDLSSVLENLEKSIR